MEIYGAKDNFTPKNKMPVTVSEGFNPEFLAVMSHDKKDEGKSKFVVHYKRSMDEFKIDWNRHGSGAIGLVKTM